MDFYADWWALQNKTPIFEELERSSKIRRSFGRSTWTRRAVSDGEGIFVVPRSF
jgi:hypothetical protein